MSNTNSKHTPMPWEIIIPEKAPEYSIVKSESEVIYLGKNKDTAELIVKAVNCHEELVEVVNWIASFVLTAKDGGEAWCAVRNQPGASEWAKKMRTVTEKLGLKY